jgi:hypothetical protein
MAGFYQCPGKLFFFLDFTKAHERPWMALPMACETPSIDFTNALESCFY